MNQWPLAMAVYGQWIKATLRHYQQCNPFGWHKRWPEWLPLIAGKIWYSTGLLAYTDSCNHYEQIRMWNLKGQKDKKKKNTVMLYFEIYSYHTFSCGKQPYKCLNLSIHHLPLSFHLSVCMSITLLRAIASRVFTQISLNLWKSFTVCDDTTHYFFTVTS